MKPTATTDFAGRLTRGAALAALILIVPACSRPAESSYKSATGDADAKTVLIRCVRPTIGALSARLEVSARVEAFERADIIPRLQGVVTAIHHVEGQDVKKGDVLAEVESDEYRIACEAQQIAVTQSQRAVAQSKLSLDEVKAQQEGQMASLAREKRRLKRATEQRQAEVITDEQLEEVRSAHDVAQAEAKRLEISIQRLTQEVGLSELRLKEAQSGLSTANLKCEWAKIRATIDGRITARTLHLGQQAQVNAAAFSISDLSSLVIHAGIPQKDLNSVSVGLNVLLTSTAWPDESFSGKVAFVSPEVDFATGTVACRIALPNKSKKLRPGLFVSGHIVTETRDGILLLPRRAILFDRDKLFVFVVDAEKDGVRKARKVYLERGLEDSDQMQCLPAPGLPMKLDATTDVVLVGMDRLLDGSPVEIESSTPAKTDSPAKKTASR